MKWLWRLITQAAPLLKAYLLPIAISSVLALFLVVYLMGRGDANAACDAKQAAAVQRAYEQGFEIATQNALFEREVVTIVKETQSETPVDDSGCRLTDDGLRNLNDFLGTP